MRLLTLELIAFGPFTGAAIDFGAAAEPVLHVVYGPNEAGKSAALRAITDLFYGIPAQTADSFLHEPGALRIGGHVRHPDGSELNFIRRKGNKNTILDREERPLDDSILQKYLAGVSKEMFTGMFGIDHGRLREGGRQLIENEGDVAVGLYAAALGMVGFRDVLKELRSEADSLFKTAGRTPQINRLITEHKDLRKQVDDFSLPGREWLQLRNAVEKTEKDLAEVVNDLLRLNSNLSRFRRIENAIPLIAERKAALGEAASLADVRLLSPDFGKKRGVAETKLLSARTAAERASGAIEQLDLEMERLQVPRELLSQDALIKEIHERLGSHRKALADEPGLRARKEQLEADALLILREFAPDADPDAANALRVSEMQRIRIHDLGTQYQAHQAMGKKASAEAGKIEGELAAASTTLERIDPPRDPSNLKRTLQQTLKRGDLDERFTSLQDRLKQDSSDLEIAFQSLSLRTAGIEDLERLPFPLPETVQRFERKDRDVTARWEENGKHLREAKALKEELDRQVEALRLAGAIPTEDDLEKARARRDIGWKLVRRSWLNDVVPGPEELLSFDPENELPAAFEAAMRGADEIADRLRREADRVAQLAQLLVGRESCLSKMAELDRVRGELAAEHIEMEAEWTALWRAAGVEPLPPGEMLTWLGKREKILEKADALRRLKTEADRIEAEIAMARLKLGACMEELDERPALSGESLTDLVRRCEDTVSRIETSARKREKLEEKIRGIERQRVSVEKDARQAEIDLAAWRGPWAGCMQAAGLRHDATPIEANAALARNREMFSKIDEARDLAARIEGIRRDAGAFAADSRSLLELVARDLLDLPVEQAVAELHTRFHAATRAAATFDQLLKRKKEQQALLQESRLAVGDASARLEEFCRQAGCERIDELEAAERQSERMRSLQGRIDGLNAQLTTLSGKTDLEAFIAEAEEADPDALPSLIAETTLQITANETKRSLLEQQTGRDRDRLAQMDGAGKALDAAQKAESTLARMREEVERYARFHLASIILDREIERYREINQGPMLTRASDIFSKLTLGSFASLKPVFDRGDKPVLAGFRPSGQTVPVTGMSEGTRDQLYLALRLASLEMQAASGETMPFVLDDILINFDDRRSEATLKVLADLSRRTQIVFFTHHRHLLDLLETAAPPELFKVHRLGGTI